MIRGFSISTFISSDSLFFVEKGHYFPVEMFIFGLTSPIINFFFYSCFNARVNAKAPFTYVYTNIINFTAGN